MTKYLVQIGRGQGSEAVLERMVACTTLGVALAEFALHTPPEPHRCCYLSRVDEGDTQLLLGWYAEEHAVWYGLSHMFEELEQYLDNPADAIIWAMQAREKLAL